MPLDLTDAQKEEAAITYASLILHDDNIPITAEKLNTVLKAAGVHVAPFWPSFFAKALANRNIDDLILNVGGAAPAPSASAPAAAVSSAAPSAKKEEKKRGEERGKEGRTRRGGGHGFWSL